MSDWLDEIEAQADETSPHYLPRLIAEVRRLRKALAPVAPDYRRCPMCHSWNTKPCGETCVWDPGGVTVEQARAEVAARDRVAPPSGAQASDKGGETHAQFVARLPSSPLPRSTEPEAESEIDFLEGLQSMLGGGPCVAVGCQGCAMEMGMAATDIRDRLALLRASSPPPPVSPEKTTTKT